MNYVCTISARVRLHIPSIRSTFLAQDQPFPRRFSRNCDIQRIFTSHRRFPPLFPDPELLVLVPSILRISYELNFNVLPCIFPIPTPPTPRSRRCFRTLSDALLLNFSKITPFSFASLLRVVSRFAALPAMPLRMCMGMFSCWRVEFLAPRSRIRMSRAFNRFLPSGAVVEKEEEENEEASRRWDSLRRRWSARSCLRLVDSVPSSSVVEAAFFAFA